MIAVMGASGNVGGKVADVLLRADQEVRVLGRSAARLEALGRRGAEVVVGDAIDPAAVQALCKGADAALVVLPDDLTDPRYAANRSQMSRVVADALRDQQVRHVVLASSTGADHGTGPIAGLHELEGLLFGLEDSNVLALRSGWYMENLLASLPLIRAQGINGSVIKADRPLPMIATVDVATEAAGRLVRRDFTGHAVKVLLGPEDLTMTEATRALGAALGLPDLPYVEFPPEGVTAALRQAGMSEEGAAVLVEAQLAINQGLVTGGVERTPATATPTPLQDFLHDALAGAAPR
jgi:uncharacterized protein YbjT (DUF2867 family)